MMPRHRIIILITLILSFTLAAKAEPNGLKKASFIPQWVPQAQFAGYYVAYEKGIYEKYGLDLTIIPGGPQHSSLDVLKKGKADFATLWLSSGIQTRAQGVKVVNIAQMVQRSALMLVAKTASGIKKPEDLEGGKVGLWGTIFQVQPRAFFQRYQLKVKVIPQTFSVNLFLRDGVDAASAMWYNEYHTILNAGIDPDELTTFFFHEHGLNFPEDGLYVLEETVRRDPELCRSFVKASIEGWQQAFAHPDETLDIVMKNLKKEYIPATRVHQKWMLARMKDLILPSDTPIPMGTLLTSDYDRVARGLFDSGLIDNIPEFNAFHQECRSHVEK